MFNIDNVNKVFLLNENCPDKKLSENDECFPSSPSTPSSFFFYFVASKVN